MKAICRWIKIVFPGLFGIQDVGIGIEAVKHGIVIHGCHYDKFLFSHLINSNRIFNSALGKILRVGGSILIPGNVTN
jgi:hypothetical protein